MRIRWAVCSGLVFIFSAASPARAQNVPWLKGFGERVDGEILGYHSAIEGVNRSLLVRSIDSLDYIEWRTEPLAPDHRGDFATFAWLANYDSTRQTRTFSLSVDGERWFDFTNAHERDWTLSGPNGATLRYHTVNLDRYGDYNGYQFLTVPTHLLEPGRPLTLRVTGESVGERTWYMVMMYGIEPSVEVTDEHALLRSDDGPVQRMRIDIVHHGDPVDVRIESAGAETIEATATLGRNSYHVPVPAVDREKQRLVRVTVGEGEPQEYGVTLKPVRPLEVFFLPHSHLDIGYTDLQHRVLRKQWQNIEQAIELARSTQGYPEGARYRWNVEGLWVVDEYLRTASAEKRKSFLDAVERGWLEVDGLYANNMTGLMREEELFRYAGENVREMLDQYGLRPRSVMITDVPGYSWGLIPALVHNGIRYFSSGPNYIPGLPHGGDRIGYTLEAWGDDPFYWEAPSGEGRILFWMSSKGYSWFHGLVDDSILDADPRPMLEYLKSLAESSYPYDMVYLRYTIGGDNGPPDPGMPDFVKRWNETYESPRLRIATVTETFQTFEERYGDVLPVRRGDFSPYWEDGAASTAQETALARNAAERLVQAEIAWSMLDPSEVPTADFREAWRNVLLFDEHTWGAWNSIDQPDNPEVIAQWEIKRQMAIDADEQSRRLLESALGEHVPAPVRAIEVLNTSSWPRTDLVRLPAAWTLAGERVQGPGRVPVSTQRLADGSLAFVARDVPPLGSKVYTLAEGPAPGSESRRLQDPVRLSNGSLEVSIDSLGNVSRLATADGLNLVDTDAGVGLNHYVYTGLNAADPRASGTARLTLLDDGPVVTTLLIESDAPGARWLRRSIELVDGLARVRIRNVLDKLDVREKENVRFGFPFRVPGGNVTLDLAWTTIEPETDQLAGSNKNYFTPQRAVDISNDEYGITLASIDAPLVEIGGMLGEAWMSEQHRPWIRTHRPSQRLYSWVMNNSWHTNFKASQSGVAAFRYDVHLHGPASRTDVKRLSIESSQPLLVRPAEAGAPSRKPLFWLPEASSVILTSVRAEPDEAAYVVRLYNAGEAVEEIRLMASFPAREIGIRERREVSTIDPETSLQIGPDQIVTLVVYLDGG